MWHKHFYSLRTVWYCYYLTFEGEFHLLSNRENCYSHHHMPILDKEIQGHTLPFLAKLFRPYCLSYRI